jgi:hypothetical protein
MEQLQTRFKRGLVLRLQIAKSHRVAEGLICPIHRHTGFLAACGNQSQKKEARRRVRRLSGVYYLLPTFKPLL